MSPEDVKTTFEILHPKKYVECGFTLLRNRRVIELNQFKDKSQGTKQMAKTLETLTAEELVILQEYIEIGGFDEVTALQIALAEGAISEEGAASVGYKPQDYAELKYHVINPKSNHYKVNKALKAAKKQELFADECFYYDTKFKKNEDGSYDLDNCSTVEIEGIPEVIVTKIAYRGVRRGFDAKAGKAFPTNFETTFADNLMPDSQKGMVALNGTVKGQDLLYILNDLKKQYHDGEAGKTQKKVPADLKVSFRVYVFGLVKINGEWKRFYMDVSNKIADKGQADLSVDAEYKKIQGMRSTHICKIEVVGQDANQNPILQLIPSEKVDIATYKSEIAPVYAEASQAVVSFIEAQKASMKASKGDKAKAKPQAEEDDGEENPFADEE